MWSCMWMIHAWPRLNTYTSEGVEASMFEHGVGLAECQGVWDMHVRLSSASLVMRWKGYFKGYMYVRIGTCVIITLLSMRRLCLGYEVRKRERGLLVLVAIMFLYLPSLVLIISTFKSLPLFWRVWIIRAMVVFRILYLASVEVYIHTVYIAHTTLTSYASVTLQLISVPFSCTYSIHAF